MKVVNKPAQYLIAFIVAAVSLFMVLRYAIEIKRESHFSSVAATVDRLDERQCPYLKFTIDNKERSYFLPKSCSKLSIGDKVTLYFDPSQPDTSITFTADTSGNIFQFPFILGVIIFIGSILRIVLYIWRDIR